MKNLKYVFYILVCNLLFLSCEEMKTLNTQIEIIKTIWEEEPERVYLILDSISSLIKEENEVNQLFLLKCKVANKLGYDLPDSQDLLQVKKWFLKNNTEEDQAEIIYFLGRAYAKEGVSEEAIKNYLHALEKAKNTQNYNLAGYIQSYLGDLYEDRKDIYTACNNYKQAAIFFESAGNQRSFALALRDIAREYAFMDSCELSLLYLNQAISITEKLEDARSKIAIYNGIGNVFRIINDFTKAENYLLLSINLDTTVNTIPGYLALSDLYCSHGFLDKSLKCLDKVESDSYFSVRYEDMVAYNRYRNYKELENYPKALSYLEQYVEIYDSLNFANQQSNIHELEKRYNRTKIEKELQELKIKRQYYIIVICIVSLSLVFLLLLYEIYRRRTKSRLFVQQKEMDDIKIKLLDLSLELEQKKSQLDSVIAGEMESVGLEREIENLKQQIKSIKTNQLSNTPIAKKVIALVSKGPNSSKSDLLENMLNSLAKEVELIYPQLRITLLDLYPNFQESDWRYCCLQLLNLDVKSEAILLNINPGSVSTRRSRFRQKLGLPHEVNICEFLQNKMIN